MNSAIEDIDIAIRARVGRAFAWECGRRELWPADGPTKELREAVASENLPTHVLVLMRFALDFYDGSGGGLVFAEAAAMLANMEGATALFFFAEFLGSALTSMPESLESWVTQYNKEFAKSDLN